MRKELKGTSKRVPRKLRAQAMRRRTTRLVRSARYLGRRSKQFIMMASDIVALPLALWTALQLRGLPETPQFENLQLLYAVSVVATIPIFVRIGLYRAVI